jgi:hypothetical protein
MKLGKVHIGNTLPTYDIEGKRVSGMYFDFDKQEILLMLCNGMGGLERRNRMNISFQSAQEIGLLNLEVLSDIFKKF